MTTAADLIRHEIRKRGPIPFVDYMGLALYAADAGYYERPGRVGREGDFFTNVSVGRLFSEMVACQIREWLSSMEKRIPRADVPKWQLVECGSNDGVLGIEVVEALFNSTESGLRPVELVFLEPSPTRQRWQQENVARRNEARGTTIPVRWCSNWSELGTVHGVVFSNELLDAFPCRRVAWDAAARRWREMGVGLEGDRFVWRPMPVDDDREVLADPHLDLPDGLLDVLPDGFTTELNPAAVDWWRSAAGSLGEGWLMAFDYGLTREEFFMPQRSEGTLRAYSRHQLKADVLERPGEQDLTAHVNFTAIEQAGIAVGLATDVFDFQGRFLTRVAQKIWAAPGAVAWDARRIAQFKTLVHPEHMGRSFRVLAQKRSPASG